MLNQSRGSKSRGQELEETESLTQKSEGISQNDDKETVPGTQLCRKEKQKPLQAGAVKQEYSRRKTLGKQKFF